VIPSGREILHQCSGAGRPVPLSALVDVDTRPNRAAFVTAPAPVPSATLSFNLREGSRWGRRWGDQRRKPNSARRSPSWRLSGQCAGLPLLARE